jgi:hypothetical protein
MISGLTPDTHAEQAMSPSLYEQADHLSFETQGFFSDDPELGMQSQGIEPRSRARILPRDRSPPPGDSLMRRTASHIRRDAPGVGSNWRPGPFFATIKGRLSSRRACSAVGSAPEWHSGGHRFDPGQVHHLQVIDSKRQKSPTHSADRTDVTLSCYCCGPFVVQRSPEPLRRTECPLFSLAVT